MLSMAIHSLMQKYSRRLWRSQRASDGISLHLASFLGRHIPAGREQDARRA